jgi:outer membrane murein-binding lipoprotein Lpp
MNTQATVTVKAARKAVYDKVESQVHTFEAKVATLTAKAQSAKADAELAAIANLARAKGVLDATVAELKSAGETTFEQVKAEVERRLTEFAQSLQAIASKFDGR